MVQIGVRMGVVFIFAEALKKYAQTMSLNR